MLGEPEPSYCDFDVWDKGPFSEKLFVERYVAPHRPVLIRGMLKGEQADQLRANWSVANIVETHPDVTFTASGIPYAEQFGLVSDCARPPAHFLFLSSSLSFFLSSLSLSLSLSLSFIFINIHQPLYQCFI